MSLRIGNLTYNPSQSNINCGKAECWAPVTCVRLKSRVLSSGATVDVLFLFVCLFICVFVCLFVFVLFLLGFFSLDFWGWGMGVEALIRKILGW